MQADPYMGIKRQAVREQVNYPSARQAAREVVATAPAARLRAPEATAPTAVVLTDSGAYARTDLVQVYDQRSWVARNPGKTASLGAAFLAGLYVLGDQEGWWDGGDDDERAAPAGPTVQAGRDAYIVTVSGTGNSGSVSQDSHDAMEAAPAAE
jgi:hypothetical protein